MKINYIVLFFVGLIVTSICFSYPVKSSLSVKNLEYIEEDTATYTASDYIQEGLIAFYDGIENIGFGEHDDVAGSWIDLTGNGRHITINPSYGAWTTDGGFFCSGEGVAGKTQVNIPDLCANIKHWEACAKIDGIPSRNTAIMLLHLRKVSTTGNIVLGHDAFSKNLRTVINKVIGYADTKKHSYSCTSYPDRKTTYFIGIDGLEITPSGDSGSGEYSNGLFVGGEGNGGCNCEGTVYCIRIYNRELSYDEIRYNYKIDKARFGLR